MFHSIVRMLLQDIKIKFHIILIYISNIFKLFFSIMANLIELLQSQMTDQVLDSLTSKIGATDRTQTKAAADGIFSTLATALSKNVQKPGGADGLLGALDRDHDGSYLDDIVGMLGGQQQQRQPQN